MQSDCTITPYRPNSSGYGGCRYMGVKVGAHVAAYLKQHGLHPDAVKGQVIMHTCDNRLCVNPDHLVLGSQSDNIKDAVAKGRTPQMRGVQGRKLTSAQVADIKSRYRPGRGSKRGNGAELAKEYGINPVYLGQIARGYHDHRQWD